ncbi:protein BIC1 isoform X2 [Arachis ipaensis]|uniref:protein BIC1 isoform X2 n=1 Tax=Arachis ipaensis TaxID=130454 RepID=UPI0007AFB0AD|nr:protein BIC1 isoform X2 [Arachis ipaensis]XP_025657956.1 protein BIC1 isoform X2 [Arachis hypogaea]
MKQDKNPPFMAHQSEADQIIPSQPLEPKDHHANMEQQQEKEEEEEEEHNSIDAREKYKDSSKVTSQDPCASKITEKEIGVAALEGEDSGREKLKRHRIEVAKRVWIPEIWEQEELLMDWIDCTAFDASLVPSTITTARAALVEQDRRRTTKATAASAGLRIENSSLHI